MAKRAVIVGINYTGTEDELSGCVNDAFSMKDLLVDTYGFAEDDIALLIDGEDNDGSYDTPTAQNILGALQTAIADTESGDILVFHYSGHGSQIEDEDGDEADGNDEFLVSEDLVPITDDVLKAEIAQLPEGAKFIMIADCCHSGSMLDQPHQEVQVTGKKNENEGDEEVVQAVQEEAAEEGGEEEEAGAKDFVNRALPFAEYLNLLSEKYGGEDVAAFFSSIPYADETDDLGETDMSNWVKSAVNKGKERAEGAEMQTNYIVLISGCMDTQTSADSSFGGTASGALTAALVSVCGNTQDYATYSELISNVRAFLAQQGYEQNPTLSCPEELLEEYFICNPEEEGGEEEEGEEEY